MRRHNVVWLAFMFVAASCVQILDGAYEYGPECPNNPTCATGQVCNADANCDDQDQCTLNLCSVNKICEYKPIDGIAPEQSAGDCQVGSCANGVLTQEPDDSDLPDDLESCTTDSCSNGLPVHEALPDGSSCTIAQAAGLCISGKCVVECNAQKACSDGNPCTEDSCNFSNGRCVFAVLDGLPTPGYQPVIGDCSQQICISGKSTALPDDADLPDDKNICTKDSCSMGVPIFTPTNVGAPCSLNGTGICAPDGMCLECVDATDCPLPVPDNGCRVRTCTNNKCGEMLVATNVDIDIKFGDCKGKYCDANGNVINQNNDKDTPDDNNPCTKNVCTNGMPSNPPEASGVNCNGASTCDGMGKCGCTTNADCGTSDECKTFACSNLKCQITYAMAGKQVASQVTGNCKVNACDGAGNIVSNIDPFDVPDDMNDCTLDNCSAQGAPSNTVKPADSSCNQNGGTVCNGFGTCLEALGSPCADGVECASGFCTDGVCCSDTCSNQCMACNVTGSTGTCINVPANSDDAPICSGTNSCDGMGTCKRDNGEGCNTAADCSSGFCADGVCCNAACTETCKSCNMANSIGICTNVPNDTVDPTGAAPCNNPYRCDGTGFCKGLNSVTCTLATDCLSGYCIDGFCCNNSCTQTCKACSNALTGGNDGTCGFILNGTDPQNECPSGNCNGSGVCTGGGGLLPNGSACASAGSCTSGFCVDGVCCNAACTESCKSCNVSASVGTCTNVPYDTIDPSGATPCNNGKKCDGNGICKKLNSSSCTTSAECFSGYCVDGYCCNNICNQLCKSCASTLTSGSDGTCSFTKAGIDPDNECATGNCNGAGMCIP